MHFRLYYSMPADPDPIPQVRIFVSRKAAMDFALRLYCEGYDLYSFTGDDGEELIGEQILDGARLLLAA